jgi:hypothetical protein
MALYAITDRNRRDAVREETRKRVDAAHLVLKRMAYDAIKGEGMLDTRYAHNIMDVVNEAEPDGKFIEVSGHLLCWWRAE